MIWGSTLICASEIRHLGLIREYLSIVTVKIERHRIDKQLLNIYKLKLYTSRFAEIAMRSQSSALYELKDDTKLIN